MTAAMPPLPPAVVEHLRGDTFHGRKGAVANRFRYGVDMVLIDAEAPCRGPVLFGRNRGNVLSVQDRDHGGAPGQGLGPVWARQVLAAHDVTAADGRLQLLTQPRLLGHVFNPVSFWLCHDRHGALRAVIAEVTNTYGDRHSYLCHHPDQRPILGDDWLTARKIMHVSPFQPVAGRYAFRFDIRPDRLGIWIDFSTDGGGVYTNLTGRRAPLTTAGILGACLRRPMGSRRVLALIHWQALKLFLKGVRFLPRPAPPDRDVS